MLIIIKQIEFDATLYTMRLIVEAVFEVFLEAEENNDQVNYQIAALTDQAGVIIDLFDYVDPVGYGNVGMFGQVFITSSNLYIQICKYYRLRSLIDYLTE